MILTSEQIRPLVEAGAIRRAEAEVAVEAVSVCLHLADEFVEYVEIPDAPFTPPADMRTRLTRASLAEPFILPPLGKVLACSQERLCMPLDLMGFIQTKGSLARGFLMAHPSDGQIDPGYEGRVTFEVVNLSDFYYALVPGMPIVSLFLHRLESTVDAPYSGRYQFTDSPTSMRAPRP
jgi:dCTP deaminase